MKNINELTPIEQLDIVLKCMCTTKWENVSPKRIGEICTVLLEEPFLIKIEEKEVIERILIKLNMDGYLLSEHIPSGIPLVLSYDIYYTTFDGHIFYSKGGYANQLKEEQAESKRKEIDNKNALIYSRWAAIGSLGATIVGAGIIIIEIYKLIKQ